MGTIITPYIEALRRCIVRGDAKILIIAVTAAELIVRFAFAATTLIILPGLAALLNGHSESVLYSSYRFQRVITLENVSYTCFPLLVGFLLLCAFAYWVDHEHSAPSPDQLGLDFEGDGEPQIEPAKALSRDTGIFPLEEHQKALAEARADGA